MHVNIAFPTKPRHSRTTTHPSLQAMPAPGVTFAVSPVALKAVDGAPRNVTAQFAGELTDRKYTHVAQTAPTTPKSFFVDQRGLVGCVVSAYCQHHNLALRPDDVWLAVTAQFAQYVTGNAEALRSTLVDFRGKKKLDIRIPPPSPIDDPSVVEFVSRRFGELIEENIKDKELRRWVAPDFSTTTETDRTLGNMMLMSTCQAFFEYDVTVTCGIPNITLEGTRADWAEIVRRAKKLGKYGEPCERWEKILVPILEQFVRAFDGKVDLGFWQRICNYIPNGSGSDHISGWISAFAVFSSEGKWQGSERGRQWTTLEDVTGSYFDVAKLPPGFATCPVNVNIGEFKIVALLIVGTIGFAAEADLFTIRPVSTWALCLSDKAVLTGFDEVIGEQHAVREREEPIPEKDGGELAAAQQISAAPVSVEKPLDQPPPPSKSNETRCCSLL
ncbi:hypothetical protein DFJ73DRAFT_859230 [Zopfochytrium polystomum]|nr:hypothetical protein DFJ73DRAFT_859230 [Zopfochytrium polystomum]